MNSISISPWCHLGRIRNDKLTGPATLPSPSSPLACRHPDPQGTQFTCRSSLENTAETLQPHKLLGNEDRRVSEQAREGREQQGCLSLCPSLALDFLRLSGSASFQRLPDPPSAHSRWTHLPTEKPSPYLPASGMTCPKKKKSIWSSIEHHMSLD